MKFVLVILTFIGVAFCYKIKTGCKTWPKGLEEKIVETSKSEACSDKAKCRDWFKMRDLVGCKIGRLAELVEGKRNIYYAATEFQTEAAEEVGKIIYTYIDSDVEEKPEIAKKEKREVHFIRACVPVNKNEKMWLDDKCPKDKCTLKAEFKGKCELPTEENQILKFEERF